VNLEFSVFLECRSPENSCLRASQLKAVTGGSVNQRKLSPSPLPNPTKRQVLINALVLTGLANFRLSATRKFTAQKLAGRVKALANPA
jgi:hypothetical protein